MTRNSMHEQILQLLRKKYMELDKQSEIEISPAILAEHAYGQLDPESLSPTLVAYTSVMELRQLARGVCRGLHQEEEKEAIDTDTGELFEGLLQQRYPAHRKGEEVYVLRAHMTRDEYLYNIHRLRKESVAKQRHSDALEAEMEMRMARGDFSQSA